MINFGLGLLAAVSVVLIALGWRGRRVDDHPYCRRCGFDLTGSTPLPSACSECGRALGRRRAVRHGRRRRRRVTLALGALLLVVCGVLAWPRVRSIPWREYAPIWVLIWEAEGGAMAALDELWRRLETEALDDGDVRDVVAAALAHQGDTAATWVPQWGALVEQLWIDGELTDEELATYIEQGVESMLQVELRSVVRLGEPIPAWTGMPSPGRVTDETVDRRPVVMTLTNRRRFMRVDLEYGLIRWDSGEMPNLLGTRRHGFEGRSRTLPAFELPLGLGTHEVTFDMEIAVFSPEDGRELHRWSTERTSSVRVVARDETAVAFEAAPELEASIRAATHVEFPRSDWYENTRGRRIAVQRGLVVFDNLPADVAFEVIAIHEGEAHRLGFAAASGGEGYGHFDVDPHDLFPMGSTVEVVLRPDATAAERTVDQTEAWDGEISMGQVALRDAGDPWRPWPRPTPGEPYRTGIVIEGVGDEPRLHIVPQRPSIHDLVARALLRPTWPLRIRVRRDDAIVFDTTVVDDDAFRVIEFMLMPDDVIVVGED